MFYIIYEGLIVRPRVDNTDTITTTSTISNHSGSGDQNTERSGEGVDWEQQGREDNQQSTHQGNETGTPTIQTGDDSTQDMNEHKSQSDLFQELLDIAVKNEDKESGITWDDIVKQLYESNERFYQFVMLVCKHVITKTKWKNSKMGSYYFEFISESDEAFALLMMDNNADRLIDMVELGKERYVDWRRTKYTPTGKGCVGRGWSLVGKKKFYSLESAITRWRDENDDRMQDLGEYVNSKYVEKESDMPLLDVDNERNEERMKCLKRSVESSIVGSLSKRKRIRTRRGGQSGVGV